MPFPCIHAEITASVGETLESFEQEAALASATLFQTGQKPGEDDVFSFKFNMSSTVPAAKRSATQTARYQRREASPPDITPKILLPVRRDDPPIDDAYAIACADAIDKAQRTVKLAR